MNKMTKGTLRRIKSVHDHVRTDTILGEFAAEPTVGRGFVIFGEALDSTKGDFRRVHTSRVKSVVMDVNGNYLFDTENSSYQLIIGSETVAAVVV